MACLSSITPEIMCPRYECTVVVERYGEDLRSEGDLHLEAVHQRLIFSFKLNQGNVGLNL